VSGGDLEEFSNVLFRNGDFQVRWNLVVDASQTCEPN
jgi:hypothetical protein